MKTLDNKITENLNECIVISYMFADKKIIWY